VQLTWGRYLYNANTDNFTGNRSVKELWKSVNSWWRYAICLVFEALGSIVVGATGCADSWVVYSPRYYCWRCKNAWLFPVHKWISEYSATNKPDTIISWNQQLYAETQKWQSSAVGDIVGLLRLYSPEGIIHRTHRNTLWAIHTSPAIAAFAQYIIIRFAMLWRTPSFITYAKSRVQIEHSWRFVYPVNAVLEREI